MYVLFVLCRYYLTGPKAGERELLLKGLPGIPDNISPSSSGGFWVAFMATRRDGMLDIMSQMPWIRNLIIKVLIYLKHCWEKKLIIIKILV